MKEQDKASEKRISASQTSRKNSRFDTYRTGKQLARISPRADTTTKPLSVKKYTKESPERGDTPVCNPDKHIFVVGNHSERSHMHRKYHSQPDMSSYNGHHARSRSCTLLLQSLQSPKNSWMLASSLHFQHSGNRGKSQDNFLPQFKAFALPDHVSDMNTIPNVVAMESHTLCPERPSSASSALSDTAGSVFCTTTSSQVNVISSNTSNISTVSNKNGDP